MPEWAAYSIQEASEKTGYNPEYLRRLVRTGKLEHAKIGRVILIRVSSLAAYIAEMDALNNNRTGPRK
jgi:excisionase family DNA binding protein